VVGHSPIYHGTESLFNEIHLAEDEIRNAPFLSPEDFTETDAEVALAFEVEASRRRQAHVGATFEATLHGDYIPARMQQERPDTSIDDTIPLDLGSADGGTEEQEDGFYIEEQRPVLDSSSGAAYDPAHHLSQDHAPFEPESGSAVEHLDLEGDFLPEITNVKDEVHESGDFAVHEDALFATLPVQVNKGQRILDDETLERLQEEMTRIEEKRTQGASNETFAALIHPGQIDVPSTTPVFTGFRQTGVPLQGCSRDHQTTKSLEPHRNHSFLSTIHGNGNSDCNAFDDSDTSPEMSIAQHRTKTRRKATKDRGDSDGSSTSRPLIPLSEETGKRIMAKDRMDQLSVCYRSLPQTKSASH
jgi:hypothetical protein